MIASLRTTRSSMCSRCIRQHLYTSHRFSSATSEASPALLGKIKNDIKTAMRAKDTTRLNVLRAIISETNQAASGPSPVRTDLQLLALLKKRKSSSVAAAQEAESHGRADLKEKQELEIAILDEYAGSVKLVGADELKEIVAGVVGNLGGDKDSLRQGTVMKELLKQGGLLDGKPVDKKELAEIVQGALSA